MLRTTGEVASHIARMRNALVLFLFILTCSSRADDRDLTLARAMLDDAVIRNDEDAMALARERLLRIAADTTDTATLRDAHYLIAVSTMFECYSGYRDLGASANLAAMGIRHIDRALELDPKSADAWMMAGALRNTAVRVGLTPPPDPPGAPNRMMHAMELDPKATAVAFFSAMGRSMNPNGGAPPEGVKMFDDLVARLDADRAATGRRFGLWDMQAHAWKVLVRIAADDPNASTLRPLSAQLLADCAGCASAQQIADAVAEHHFVAAPSVTWQPFLTDAAGDGKNPKLPDVVGVDRADDGDLVWVRVTFHDPLPRSFGVNIAVNRSGDPASGMKWWGKDSTFRFDRLVTAWISRDGDRYFGRIGITDPDGARTAHMRKLSSDVQLAMGSDDRSVMIGVRRDAIGITDKSTVVVAGGSHLVWNDDATIAANSR